MKADADMSPHFVSKWRSGRIWDIEIRCQMEKILS